jgi:hypothetical protein
MLALTTITHENFPNCDHPLLAVGFADQTFNQTYKRDIEDH